MTLRLEVMFSWKQFEFQKISVSLLRCISVFNFYKRLYYIHFADNRIINKQHIRDSFSGNDSKFLIRNEWNFSICWYEQN